MKKFREIREDTFDKSKAAFVGNIEKSVKQIELWIKQIEKMDKQGEGKGEMAKDIKTLKKDLEKFNIRLSAIATTAGFR
mgnify:CR=1 FL=1